MGIDLHWETENGEMLGQAIDQGNHLLRLVPSLREQSFICLKFLDEYGDSVFNQNQLPILIEELQKIKNNADGEAAKVFSAMLDLANRAKGQTLTYLKFYGD